MEYVVLSSVRTLSGLYLVDPIDMEKSSSQLRSYIDKIKKNKIYLINAEYQCHKYHENNHLTRAVKKVKIYIQ